MKQLPKAIPELDGGLYLPRQVVDLVEVLLQDHERLLQAQPAPEQDLAVLAQARELLRFTGLRPALPPARDQLGMEDPDAQRLARNLMRG